MEASERILLDETDLLVENLQQEVSRLREELSSLQREARYRLEEEREQHRRVLKEERSSIEERLRAQQQRFAEELAEQHKLFRTLQERVASYEAATHTDSPQVLMENHPSQALGHLLLRLDPQLVRISEQLTRAGLKEAHPDAVGLLHACRKETEHTLQQVRRLQSYTEDWEHAPELHRVEVDLLVFFKELARQQNWMGQNVRLFASPKLPQVAYFDESLLREALLTLLKQIHLFVPEAPVRITLKRSQVPETEIPRMHVLLISDQSWKFLESSPLRSLLQEALSRSELLGLDFLVAYRYITQHEGALHFLEEGGDVVGFEVLIPLLDPPDSEE